VGRVHFLDLGLFLRISGSSRNAVSGDSIWRLDLDLLVGRRTLQQIKMTLDNTKAFLTAATPTIAMVSLAQINEVAALVGSLLGIAFLLWRWRKQWKSGDLS
jgi:hypothetical protein